MGEVIKNRYDFVVLFEVENGNPNGDPDADNMPRIDLETNQGIVTDVCLKRKIRNYVEAVKENEDGYRIYIKEKVPLNSSDKEAYKALGLDAGMMSDDARKKEVDKRKKDDKNFSAEIKDFMCREFYDIRAFGAVMTTFKKDKVNSGQVRGPVQLGFAKSIDPIFPQEITVTRMAITTESDAEKKETEFGHKYIVPYGLYRVDGYVSANLARKVTGFDEDDLELLWNAIINMFELDHAAARGNMSVRKLIVFKHESEFGNAPAFKLFENVIVKRKDETKPARCFADYEVTVVDENLPLGVTCEQKL